MRTQSELWRPVVGFTRHYAVSSYGRVRTLERLDSLGRRQHAKILRTYMPKRYGNAKGGLYLFVVLHKDGVRYRKMVHLLILEAFVGPRPPGKQACHRDDDRLNNRLENLRWDTPKANHEDKIRNGRTSRGQQNGSSKLTEDLVRMIWRSQKSAERIAQELGLNSETIGRIRRGQSWQWLTSQLGPQPQRIRRKRKQFRRTHCPKGHPYKGGNLRTYEAKGRWRVQKCRTCDREYRSRERTRWA